MVHLAVYGNKHDLSCQMVFILLEELQLKYVTNDVDTKDIDAIKKLNPLGKLPVVVYGDKQLTEPRAILRYISRNNIELADLWLNGSVIVDEWMEIESRNLSPYLIELLDNSGGGKTLEKVEVVLDMYEDRLKDNMYICGDKYSIVDIVNIPYLYAFVKGGYKDVVKKRPAVYSWVKRMMKREAVDSVLHDKN